MNPFYWCSGASLDKFHVFENAFTTFHLAFLSEFVSKIGHYELKYCLAYQNARL